MNICDRNEFVAKLRKKWSLWNLKKQTTVKREKRGMKPSRRVENFCVQTCFLCARKLPPLAAREPARPYCTHHKYWDQLIFTPCWIKISPQCASWRCQGCFLPHRSSFRRWRPWSWWWSGCASPPTFPMRSPTSVTAAPKKQMLQSAS